MGNEKITVRLAAETLSNSVANSSDMLLIHDNTNFQNSEATVKFIKTVDKTFNICNNKNMISANIFEQALKKEPKDCIFKFRDETISYFKSLSLDGKNIINSGCQIGFNFNFQQTLTNIKNICNDFVETGIIDYYFPTFNLSQDQFTGYMYNKSFSS